MPDCRTLTWKAKGQQGLQTIYEDSELWEFVSSWIRKFPERPHERQGEKFERFIFLWVSVNAWASMAVPDQSRNHEDAYLVHSMGRDPQLGQFFANMLGNSHFSRATQQLAGLGPVFQVLWLKNNAIPAWQRHGDLSRQEYVRQVFEKDPFHRTPKAIFPAFAPACALTHQSNNEPIPADWPHLLSMIYQVRCNLFHGGKTYESSSDQHFVDLAFQILWNVWRQILPSRLVRDLPWPRLFVRSGILFKQRDDTLLLDQESAGNISFLARLLRELGWEDCLQGNDFHVPPVQIPEQDWLAAWEKCKGGAEGGPMGLANIELEIMDTHMAGIVRWLNALGYQTTYSCDGHGKSHPQIGLADAKRQADLAKLIHEASRGALSYCEGKIGIANLGGPPPLGNLLKLGEGLHGLWQQQQSNR